jgi:hypothetical protein
MRPGGVTTFNLCADIDLFPDERISWIRLPWIISYVTWLGRVSGSVSLPGSADHQRLEGLALVEHAFGRDVLFDPMRLVSGPWHWDVLRFDGEIGLALLALTIPGLGFRGVRSGGRVPGAPFQSFRKVQLEGAGGALPSAWRGRLRDRQGGELTYEAAANTSVADAAPGVGFVGFEWEASYLRRGAPPARLHGHGFAEMGCSS